ncbi:hypothetical protein WH47_08035, partial [Habropoda laboriosa]
VSYFESLSRNKTIHSDELLNRNEMRVCRDNARPHMAQNVQKKQFDNIDNIGNNIEKYFNDKPKKFYSDGIMALQKDGEKL